ncbi:Fur family transcriptional regulator [Luteibacter yeojuensis]|uniref:Fur family transcriptional regulator n=1 Tax=Luteibacter yeojuensis TaxID=345309 RepID=UPI0006972343|nr:transcriptional repressor [Luteibacter yeojuensis]
MKAMTPMRRDVLQIIARQRTPLSAYDVLAQLKISHASATATGVYRSIGWLEERKFVRRIASLRAFIACSPAVADQPGLLLCRHCYAVSSFEHAALGELIEEHARTTDFNIASVIFEVWGTCATCHALHGDAERT